MTLLSAFHGSEIPYVFGNTTGAAGPSQAMMAYWVRFAATGDPNGNGLPRWPAYTASRDPYMEFAAEAQAKTELRKESLDLFEKIATERRRNRKQN